MCARPGAGRAGGGTVTAAHSVQHDVVQVGMADLDLLAGFSSIGPDIPAGGVHRIVSGQRRHIAAGRWWGHSQLYGITDRPAGAIGDGESDGMPSSCHAPAGKGLIAVQDAVPVRPPEILTWLILAGFSLKEYALLLRKCPHILRRDDLLSKVLGGSWIQGYSGAGRREIRAVAATSI